LRWPILVEILADIYYSQTSLVTCILVNWTRHPETIACFGAFKITSYCALNIVVVDTASNDDSVDQIRSTHPTVTDRDRTKFGFRRWVQSRNSIRYFSGAEYVLLFNNDTQPNPSALQNMVSVGEADPRIGAVSGEKGTPLVM